jgi:hypothetical protein
MKADVHIQLALFKATVEQSTALNGKLNQRPKQIFVQWQKLGNMLWDEMLKTNQVSEEYLDSISDIYHNINLEIKKNIV